jgi:hypothetical protein
MGNIDEITRARARKILKDGILDMSVERLLQMTKLGLTGTVELITETLHVDSIYYNHMLYDEENDVITFMWTDDDSNVFGAVSFPVGAITKISGSEDEEDPEEILDIQILLNDQTNIFIEVMY